MSIYEKAYLKNMSINVEQLGNKHQLNPNNTGVIRIDDCLAFSKNSGIFRCEVLSIRQNGTAPIQLIECKSGDDVIMQAITLDTEVMTADGNYVSIKDGTLKLGTNLLVASGNVTYTYAVTQVTGGNTGYTYKIKTSRNNYVLESGIVVKSD